MSRPNRVLAILVAGIVALAVLATVVTALRPGQEYAEDTPEGTVQAFLRDTFARDYEAAAARLSRDSPCGVADLERHPATEPSRVVLERTTLSGQEATVRVQVVRTQSGPLGGSESSRTETISLVTEDGQWRISDTPWPLFGCGRSGT